LDLEKNLNTADNSRTTDLIKDTITISCKECSIDGIIELTEGEFTVGDSDTLPFKAKDFIDHGYFKTVANGMKAHIELDTKLELSSTQTFDMALATISLPGFSVSHHQFRDWILPYLLFGQ
jgi:hypothetical protein